MAAIPPGLRAPDPISFEGNVAESWREFETNFTIYRKAALKKCDADEVAYILLNLAGPEAVKRERTFTYKPEVKEGTTVVSPGESREDPDCLISKFRELCSPKTNVIVERHKFNTRYQRDETTEQYITDLKKLATTCEYGNLKDDLIRDRLVCGVNNESIRRQILKEADLTLQRAIQLCQIDELTNERLKEMSNVDVDEVRHDSRRCYRCDRSHTYGRCPAFRSMCDKCGGRNHWSVACRATWGDRRNDNRRSEQIHEKYHKKYDDKRGGQKYSSGSKYRKKKVYEVICEDSSDGEDEQVSSKYRKKKVYEILCDNSSDSDDEQVTFHLDSIETNKHTLQDEAHVQLKLNGKDITMKVDTGAKINVMKLDVYESLQQERNAINAQGAVLIKAYGGEKFSTLGTVELECEHKGRSHSITFHIVPSSRPGATLIGLNDSLKLGLVELAQEVYHLTSEPIEFEQYEELFDDSTIGKLPVTYKMKVDEEITPVVKAPRRIPAAVRNDVKQELTRMEGLGVIRRVEEATDWVSSMVAAKKKSGEIRVCLDPRDLNKAMKRPHHPMKTIEEVISDMPNAEYFSVLDAKAGFWQIPLNDDSMKYTTFNSPFGRYQFMRLPFGLNSSAEVFQRTMEQLFSGYPCSIIVDDILVSGATVHEHDENLQKVLKRCEEVNLRLNKKKCKIRVQEVSYVGHKLTKNGVDPDPSKIEAITSMPPPEDKKGIQRLLGMTNYLAKFIPNYSEKTTVLRELLHKDTKFCWLQQHQEAFEALKTELTSPSTLQYYDGKKPVVLTCDASQSGIGAAMLQNEKPVAYASRALT